MRYHMIGIKGSGMSGLAEILRTQGHAVTGSDLNETGHKAENVQGAEVVVHTPAVRPGSPGWVEVQAAQAQGSRVLRADELIAELTEQATVIAIAGMHGKSTTTSMAGVLLERAGLDPSVYIGAPVLDWHGRSWRVGRPDLWVVEADEYERKLLLLKPTIAVITNIDLEHLDIYKDLDDIEATFTQFIAQIRPGGTLVAWEGSPSIDRIIERAHRTDITVLRYGVGQSTYAPTILPQLSVPGLHNQLNALAVLAIADCLQIPRETALPALAAFRGASRRLELIGERDGVLVMDDYGHHPTEIRASLAALRHEFPARRLVVAFQPHQHIRLQKLFADFTTCFADADAVYVTDVFAVPGREEAVRVDPRDLVEAIGATGTEAHYVGSLADLSAQLGTIVRANDLFLTLGATDVTKVGREWIAAMERDG